MVNDIFNEIVENLIDKINNYQDNADANKKKIEKKKTERLNGNKNKDSNFKV